MVVHAAPLVAGGRSLPGGRLGLIVVADVAAAAAADSCCLRWWAKTGRH